MEMLVVVIYVLSFEIVISTMCYENCFCYNTGCGELKESNRARMVNAEAAKSYYPWIAHIKRFNADDDDQDDDDTDDDDSGSETNRMKVYDIILKGFGSAIISTRTILTCAHCVCDYLSPNDEHLEYCKLNSDDGTPTNQHVPYADENDDDDDQDIYEKQKKEDQVFITEFNEIQNFISKQIVKNIS